MPAIPYQPADIDHPHELVSAIRERRGGELLNLDRMLLHSPAFASGWNGFLLAVRNSLSVPAQLRELAICVVAILNAADYELIQHAPLFVTEGGSEEQLESLKKSLPEGESPVTGFDQHQQIVIRLCIEMTNNVKVSEAVMQEAEKALDSHLQLVELVGIIAAYNMVSRFLVALRIEPEGANR